MGRTGRRQVIFTLLDQGASSLTNLLVGVAAARSLSLEDFGAYGVAIAVYLIAVNIVRALVSEPYLIRCANASASESRQLAGAAALDAASLGAVGTAILLLASSILSGALVGALLVLAAVLPLLMLQDFWRFALFARRSAGGALVNDAMWLLVTTVGLALASGHAPLPVFLGIWGLGAAIGGIMGFWQVRPRVVAVSAFGWVRRELHLGWRFGLEYIIEASASQVAFFVLAANAGLAAIGAVNAARLITGPLTVVYLGAGAFVVPEARRRIAQRRFGSGGFIHLLALVLGISGVLYGLGCVVLPDQIGEALLGSAWTAAGEVIVPWALFTATIGVLQAYRFGLRSLADARRSLRARAVGAPPLLVASTIGALTHGATGAVWGYLLGGGVAAVGWCWQFRAGVKSAARQDWVTTDTEEAG